MMRVGLAVFLMLLAAPEQAEQFSIKCICSRVSNSAIAFALSIIVNLIAAIQIKTMWRRGKEQDADVRDAGARDPTQQSSMPTDPTLHTAIAAAWH
jgi:hypothetical protein